MLAVTMRGEVGLWSAGRGRGEIWGLIVVLYASNPTVIPQGDCAMTSLSPRTDVRDKVGEIGVLDTNMRSVWLHDAFLGVYLRKLSWGLNLVPHPYFPTAI